MPFKSRCNPASLLTKRNARAALRPACPPVSAHTAAPPFIRQNTRIQVRYNSTSSLFSPFTSFFSRARKARTPDEAAQDYSDALGTRSAEALSKAYYGVCKDPDPSRLISKGQLLEGMRLMADNTSKNAQALHMLKRIYRESSTHFGYSVRKEHKQALIKGYLGLGMVKEALKIAIAMQPEDVDWRSMLLASVKANGAVAGTVVEIFRRTTVPKEEDYVLLLRILRSHPKRSNIHIDSLLDEMKSNGIAFDLAMQAEIMQGHIALEQPEKARRVMDQWDLATLEGVLPVMWDAKLQFHIATHDIPKLQTTVRTMRDAGLEVSQDAVLALAIDNLAIDSKSTVMYPDAVAAIDSAEQMCGTVPGNKVWSGIIRHYLDKVRHQESYDVAMMLYEECLGRRIRLDGELARSLIIPLSAARSPSRLDDAFRVYGEFMSTASEAELKSEDTRTRFALVYPNLLRACSRANPSPMASVIRLLSDMRTLSLEFASADLTSLLLLLMRASPDHLSAYSIYSHFHALNPGAINRDGFSHILTTFLSLSWETSPYPPPDLFISIMKDMDRAGHPPDPMILSALLKQYGHLATRTRREITKEDNSALINIARSIGEIHTLIKLDPLISPGIPILTALMDAYNRVGAYPEAFEVWDELVQRLLKEPPEKVRKLHGAAISVMLDACGWSYYVSKARKTWNWANRCGFIHEKRQWDTWVECLCRCGEMSEAGHVVMDKMGQDGIPKPDKETVQLLIKFGRKHSEKGYHVEAVGDLFERIESRWPEWWDELNSQRLVPQDEKADRE